MAAAHARAELQAARVVLVGVDSEPPAAVRRVVVHVAVPERELEAVPRLAAELAVAKLVAVAGADLAAVVGGLVVAVAVDAGQVEEALEVHAGEGRGGEGDEGEEGGGLHCG